MKKRFLSWLLAILMITSMIPASLFTSSAITADDLYGLGTAEYPYWVGNYSELFAAEHAYKNKNERVYIKLTQHLTGSVILSGKDTYIYTSSYGLGSSTNDHFEFSEGSNYTLGSDGKYLGISRGYFRVEGTFTVDNGVRLLNSVSLGNDASLAFTNNGSTYTQDIDFGNIYLYDGSIMELSCWTNGPQGNLTFYDGALGRTDRDRGFAYNLMRIRPHYNGYDTVDYSDVKTNTFLITDGNGEVEVIKNIDQLIDYGKNRNWALVCGAGIINQEPALPYGAKSMILDTVTASSYPIKFSSISMAQKFKDAGYYMQETLTVLDSKSKVVYTYTQEAGNNSGIKYDLNKLPSGVYDIRETVSIHDKNGKEITSTTQDIMVIWNYIDPCTFKASVGGVESTTKTKVELCYLGTDTAIRTLTLDGSEPFTFYNIEPGNYTLKATADGYQPYSKDMFFNSGVFDYIINMETYHTVSGQIRNVKDTTETTVELWRYENDNYTYVDSATVTGKGTYLFEGLPNGDYRLSASAHGYIPQKAYLKVNDDIPYNFIFEEPKFTSFENEFEAFAGDTVTLSWKTNFTPLKVRILRYSSNTKYTAYDLDDPKQTTYDVKMIASVNPPVKIAVGIWYGEGSNDYIVEDAYVNRLYGVYVKTNLIDNEYHSGEATLTLVGESEPRYTTTWTDGYHGLYDYGVVASNAFAFHDVRPGTYTLKIIPDGFSMQEATVIVGNTDVTTQDFYMKNYCTGSVSGVKDTDVTTITLWKKNGDGSYTKTAYSDTVTGNDDYSIQMVDKATYRVVATCPGYVDNITAKDLTESGSRHFVMTLATDPAFTKQPLSGEVAPGEFHIATWETNFEPAKLVLVGYKEGAPYTNQNLDVSSTSVELSSSMDYHVIRAYYNNTEYISSNKIYITEVEKVITHTVTFMVNGSAYSTDTVEEGTAVTRPEDPVKIGKRFLGWYTKDDAVFNFSTAITEDLTLYAKYEILDSSGVYGDTDNNGRITLSDVLLLRKYLAGIIAEDDLILDNADVDGSGRVTIADVLLLRKYLAGLITEFPAEK